MTYKHGTRVWLKDDVESDLGVIKEGRAGILVYYGDDQSVIRIQLQDHTIDTSLLGFEELLYDCDYNEATNSGGVTVCAFKGEIEIGTGNDYDDYTSTLTSNQALDMAKAIIAYMERLT